MDVPFMWVFTFTPMTACQRWPQGDVSHEGNQRKHHSFALQRDVITGHWMFLVEFFLILLNSEIHIQGNNLITYKDILRIILYNHCYNIQNHNQTYNDSNILSILFVMSFGFVLTSLCTEHRYCIPAQKKQGPGGYETLKHRLDATAKIMEYLGPQGKS